ncbi:MAG: hydrolase [Patescibacteria group bacterium]
MVDEKEICCPKFDPAPWDEKEVVWKDRLFMTDYVRSIMHIPLNMGQVITRMWKAIEAADAKVPDKDFVLLSFEYSPWKSEQFIPVTKEVPGFECVKLSGTYLTKVFEGPYKDAPVWYKEMLNYVKGQGKEAKKIYFYYTTCPKCAKKYGKNYVVVLAEI